MILLGIYTKEKISAYYGDTHIAMFIAALVTIANLWNQSGCPTMDE
jgi:hypothetical protein